MGIENTASTLFKVHENRITIRDNGVEYHDSLENFVSDSGMEVPPVPGTFKPGFNPIGALYVPGELLRASNGRSSASVPGEWPEALEIIQRITPILEAKEAREKQLPIEDDGALLKAARTQALEALLDRLAQDPNATPEEKDYQRDRMTRPTRDR